MTRLVSAMEEKDPLKVLQAAREFRQQVIALARKFPRHAPPGLRAQLVKAARSVSSNIAGGMGRGTDAEMIRYSSMANGSLEESQTHLRECVNTHLIDRKTFYKSWNLSVAISRMLAALIEYHKGRSD